MINPLFISWTMLYGTPISYIYIFQALFKCHRHHLCLPEHQRQCENGCTFNSDTLWILDLTACRSVWIDV